jgi:hypothetical protein
VNLIHKSADESKISTVMAVLEQMGIISPMSRTGICR